MDKIRSASTPDQWSHVPTSQNPADLATRSVHAKDIQPSMWLQRPDFRQIGSMAEGFPLVRAEAETEVRPEIVSTKTTIEEDTCLSVDHIIRFSSWNKLVKGMTFIKRSLRFRGKENTSGTAKGSHEVGMEIMKDA